VFVSGCSLIFVGVSISIRTSIVGIIIITDSGICVIGGFIFVVSGFICFYVILFV
jgi:hypothetical protein